jgi:hypothetical protein
MVVNDNNKAQRNMQVFGYGGMTGTSATAMSMYALVHNAAIYFRDVPIGVHFDPRHGPLLKGATLAVVGAENAKRQPVDPHGVLTVPRMAPGENRWVELTFNASASAKEPVPLDILELRDGVPVNGYRLSVTPMKIEGAIRETLLQHVAVFTRLSEAFGMQAAREQAKAAATLASHNVDAVSYGNFLKQYGPGMVTLTDEFIRMADPKDTLRMRDTASLLAKSAPAKAQPVHLTFLNKLDAAQTMRQKAGGDIADIPQNVRWQRDLFARLKRVPGAPKVVASSSAFLTAFESRKITVDAFQKLVDALHEVYAEAAALDNTGRAKDALAAIGKGKSLASLQAEHRALLLALDPLAP